jgi:hypothetical protein
LDALYEKDADKYGEEDEPLKKRKGENYHAFEGLKKGQEGAGWEGVPRPAFSDNNVWEVAPPPTPHPKTASLGWPKRNEMINFF